MKPQALSSSARGHLLALGATVIWSLVYLFARTLADRFSPVELTFWRWTVAFAALFPFVYRRVWVCREAIRRHIVRLAVFSLFGMVGFSALVFLSGKTSSVTNMSLLAATAPIFIALVSRFILKERLDSRQVLGLGIAVCGVVVLVTRGDPSLLLNLGLSGGDLWMLAGALCFGTYTILVRYRPASIPQVEFLTVLMGLGALWMLPFVAYGWCFGAGFTVPTPGEAFSLLCLGVLTSVIAFLWWNEAIARIGSVRCGAMYYSLPFFSFLLAMVTLGERLSLPQAVGGILIIGGILFSSLPALMQAHRAERHGRR
jgi:Predicted permeases